MGRYISVRMSLSVSVSIEKQSENVRKCFISHNELDFIASE
jgi:hypothetical protein